MALISVPIYSYKKQAKKFSLSETGKKINFYRSLLLQRIKASANFSWNKVTRIGKVSKTLGLYKLFYLVGPPYI